MNKKILVVDDEPDMVDILQLYLQDAGYEVITAPSGTEAVRKAKKMNPNLILLDILMVPINSYEVIKQLQKDPAVRNISVVILTAIGSEDKDKALKMGVKEYITKPFNEEDLLRKVKIALGS